MLDQEKKEASRILSTLKYFVNLITSTIGIIKPLIVMIVGAMWWATAFIYEVKETKAEVQELKISQKNLEADINNFKTQMSKDIGVIKGHTSALVDFYRIPVKDTTKENKP